MNRNGQNDDSLAGLESVADATSEVLELVEDKYDKIKDRLFDEMGKAAFRNLSEAERQRKIFEMKKRERELRRKGMHEEANKMLKEFFGNDAAVKELAKAEKQKRIADLRERIEEIRRKNKGNDSEEENSVKQELEDLKKLDIEDPFSHLEKSMESEKATMLDDILKGDDESDDSLKNKLFADALMAQFTEAEWNKMSEKDRQQKIFEMKRREMQLKKEGRWKEANQLIREAFNHASKLSKDSDDQRERRNAKIRERIAKAKQNHIQQNDSTADLESVVDTTSEVLDLVEDKYAALKDKLFDEMGRAAFQNLSEAERQRKIVEMKKRERELRKRGMHEEAKRMMKEFFGNDESVKMLAKSEKEKRIADLKKRRDEIREKNKGEISEEENIVQREVEELEKLEVTDPFSLLEKDMESEKAAILGQYLQWQSQDSTEKLRQLQAIKLRLDKKKIAQEENFEAASQVFALMKQNQAAEDFESDRQKKLARARIAARHDSRAKFETELDEKNTSTFPTAESKKESVILTVDQRHHEESGKLILFFQSDPCNLDPAEMAQRFTNLAELRASWLSHWSNLAMENESISEDETQVLREQLDILKEMTGISRTVLKSVIGSDDEEAKESLLTKLQEIQTAERNEMLSLNEVSDGDLDTERGRLKYPSYENIAKTIEFFTSSLNAPAKVRDDVSVELSKKYDAMKDVMVMEGLMKQHGEAEWFNMTERERQAKLMKVRMQERRLKQEGKMIEAAALLNKLTGESETAKRMMEKSMNEQKSNTRERIRRKLELKKERQKEGKDTSDAVLDVVLDMEETEKGKSAPRNKDVMSALEGNYEEERKAIMASLQSQRDQVSADKVRQLEIAKMRIERAKLKREGNLDEAAKIFEKANLAEKGKSSSFNNEQDRQRKLAQERIMKMKQRKKERDAEEETTSIQESILLALDEKQRKQSEYLTELVSGIDAVKLSELEKLDAAHLREALEIFSANYEEWKKGEGTQAEIEELFKSVASHKVAELIKIVGSLEGATVTLEAALREKQTKEQRTLEQVMVSSEVDDQELMHFYQKKNTENWKDDIAGVLSTPEAASITTNNESLMKELNDEFEKEKGQLKDTSGADQANYDSEVKRLEEQYAAKRRAMQSAFSRQKSATLQKLAARKAAKERKDDDAEAAALMVAAMKEEQRKVAEQQNTGKERQRALMQSRLAARKRARELEREEAEKAKESNKKPEEEQEKEEEEEEEVDKREISNMSENSQPSNVERGQEGSVDLPATGEGEVPILANPQIDSWRQLEREGSFASVDSDDMSDGARPKRARPPLKSDDTFTGETEQEILSKLEREQTTIQRRTIKEIESSKHRLNQRLERLKREREKKGALRDQAKEILGMGERQKTILETMREEERQRATTNVRERIEKVKTERTKTMKERRDNNAAQFREMMDPAQLEGLTEAESMTKIASMLQERMLAQEKELREGKRKIMVPEADDVVFDYGSPPSSRETVSERDEIPPGLLELPSDLDLNQSIRARSNSPRHFQEDRMRVLKERRQRKKEERAKSAERNREPMDSAEEKTADDS